MKTYEALRSWIQFAEWVLLAVAAINLWRRRRDMSSTWIAATFASLALVVAAGMAIGRESDPDDMLLFVKVLIAVIALFPYCLYRFVDSIFERGRWAWRLAHVFTAAVLIATALLPHFPQEGEPRPGWMTVWLVLFMVQWIYLLVHVAWRLWHQSGSMPAVGRRRMRTMGTAALILAGSVAASSFGSNDEITVARVITDIATTTAGPLFLFGFAPPGFLRAYWRRREEAELRLMEIGLVKALSREDIAKGLLPAVVNLFGGEGAALFHADGSVLGSQGLSADRLDMLREELPIESEHYKAVESDNARIVPMETGWLVITSGAFTPFFETEELQMLAALSVMADLALGRAKLYELERQAREAMRDFVAIASHDLRTPVTVIQGFAQLLNEQWDVVADAKRKDFIQAIGRQVVALDRLIRDLLTVSKLDVNEIEVAPTEVDLAAAANETIHTLACDAMVTVDANGHTPKVFADPDHVARMLQNYVRNAMIYGAPPYEVQIVGGDRGVTVYVRDRGVGVPEDFVPRLFEKFARVDKKKSKAVQGTGLGLSIVRGLARANGGDAWYEGGHGKGATFAFRLPEAEHDRPEHDHDQPELELKGTA